MKKKDKISRLTLPEIFNLTASGIIVCSSKFIKAMDQRQFKLMSPRKWRIAVETSAASCKVVPIINYPYFMKLKATILPHIDQEKSFSELPEEIQTF